MLALNSSKMDGRRKEKRSHFMCFVQQTTVVVISMIKSSKLSDRSNGKVTNEWQVQLCVSNDKIFILFIILGNCKYQWCIIGSYRVCWCRNHRCLY